MAAEEGILDRIVLTNEQGLIGGAPATVSMLAPGETIGAMIDMPTSSTSMTAAGSISLSCLRSRSIRTAV